MKVILATAKGWLVSKYEEPHTTRSVNHGTSSNDLGHGASARQRYSPHAPGMQTRRREERSS